MPRFVWLSLVGITFMLSSCGNALPALNGVDLSAWKSDKNGCNGERMEMAGALETEKEKILGLSETEVVALLGKPDQNELYKRNQKFYSYFVEPSDACADGTKSDRASRLVIRFNAVGLAKEVSVDN